MQQSFRRTMYVYERPRCECRHWDTENLEEEDGALSLFCSVCESPEDGAYVMLIVDEFAFNPFNFEPPARLPV